VLTVDPILVASLTLSPTTVVGGTTVSGTVTLNAVAGPGSKAISVRLTTTTIAAEPPVTVIIPIGASSANFTVTTKAVAKNTVATITATLGLSSQKATVTIDAPALKGVVIDPYTVQGSALTVVTGTVTISSPAPYGFVVMLKSSDTEAALVPIYVIIPEGKITGAFRVTHRRVTATSTVTVTAVHSTDSQTTMLTVTP